MGKRMGGMARQVNRLSALDVQRAKAPGLYPDGGGLYLQVVAAGTGSWLLRYRHGGRRRDMGLGSSRDVTLAEARQKATESRRLLASGVDPIEARRAQQAAALASAAQAVTFKECARRYIEAHTPSWRNTKHAAQWPATLGTYAYPHFGSHAVGAVMTSDVLSALEPIWTKKPETASRLRGRIEAVLDYAKARGWRAGENPARWRGHLKNLLPARAKIARVQHHAALPYASVGDFTVALRAETGTAARALDFTILTAVRTGETIGARWPEIDWEALAWDIPAERMKMDRPHRVPLCPDAVAILRAMLPLRDPRRGDWIFPGGKPGKGLSDAAMAAVIDRMNEGDEPQWVDPKRGNRPVTPHGFRSTFKDWASETTAWPGELTEACLAHAIKNKVEGAYRRGDLFQKRAQIMGEWAAFCGAGPKVVDLAAVRAAVAPPPALPASTGAANAA
jgi:integrase